MCRLFAFVAPQLSAVNRELGTSGIEDLISLARAHDDGWGWSGVRHAGTDPTVYKSVQSAGKDPELAATLNRRSRAAMVHLRMATLGLDVEMNNTHPFLTAGVSFAHNGSLKPIGRMREMLLPASLAEMQGETDSEMYFALIQENMATGMDLSSATWTAVVKLRRAFPGCSLNAFLLDANELIVVHANAESALAEDVLRGFGKFHLPNEHADDYYGLRWTVKSDGTIVVGSTGVAKPDWLSLPDESVVTVGLANLRISIMPLMAQSTSQELHHVCLESEGCHSRSMSKPNRPEPLGRRRATA